MEARSAIRTLSKEIKNIGESFVFDVSQRLKEISLAKHLRPTLQFSSKYSSKGNSKLPRALNTPISMKGNKDIKSFLLKRMKRRLDECLGALSEQLLVNNSHLIGSATRLRRLLCVAGA